MTSLKEHIRLVHVINEINDKKISENKKHIETLKEENKNLRQLKIDEYDIIRNTEACRNFVTNARKEQSNNTRIRDLNKKNKLLEKEKRPLDEKNLQALQEVKETIDRYLGIS